MKVPLLLIGQHAITIEGKMISLTRNEFLFLQLLSNQDGICSRHEVAEWLSGNKTIIPMVPLVV